MRRLGGAVRYVRWIDYRVDVEVPFVGRVIAYWVSP